MTNLACKTEKETLIFAPHEIELLDKSKIPYHIAIVPDGNRRWAKFHYRDIQEGYIEGTEAFITTVRAAKELGVKALTVYGFSTENWSRPKKETLAVLEIIEQYLRSYQQKLLDFGIRLHIIGNEKLLPTSLINTIEETKKLTNEASEFDLIIALNYGGRDEICRAVRKIVEECINLKIKPESLTEEFITQRLDTFPFPDPDLLIRTSGEKRMSNFLLWQSSYTEIYIENDPWPQFTPQHLLKAIKDFQGRSRRLGGGSSEHNSSSL